MYVQLFTVFLLANQIIANVSSVINGNSSSGQTLSEGYINFSEDRAAYKIHEELLTWFEARDRCSSEGGRLAITDSRDKIVHINSIKKPSGQWIHVGIHKSNTTNEWVRVDNDLPVTSVPWKSGNPDDTGNCAGISFVGVGLVDYPCNGSGEYFVCEIPT